MSSSNKYYERLNHWAAGDKPSMSDFNADNEYIAANAMWKDLYDNESEVLNAGGIGSYAMAKSNYDSAGKVSEKGGIVAYALSKEDYDADGSIAALGGIANAINAAIGGNGGFTTCVYVASNEESTGHKIHLLCTTTSETEEQTEDGTANSSQEEAAVGAADGNICFIATAAYKSGDIIRYNDINMTPRIQGSVGALPDNFWLNGDLVFANIKGNVITFLSNGTTATNTNRAGATLRNCAVVYTGSNLNENNLVPTNCLIFSRESSTS